MIEKIKAIRNPLTVVAIFAGLAEIAGTIALATVDKSLQHVFVWFVMLFPVLLVILFFVTLNFNHKVFYAPSDFRDEAHFLKVMTGSKESATHSQIQITRETIEQTMRNLADRGMAVVDLSSVDVPICASEDCLRELVVGLTKSIMGLFESGRLRELWFNIYPEVLLVVLEYNQEKLPPKVLARSAFIIRGKRKSPDSVSLEVVGTDIVSEKASVVAEAVAQRVYSVFQAEAGSKRRK